MLPKRRVFLIISTLIIVLCVFRFFPFFFPMFIRNNAPSIPSNPLDPESSERIDSFFPVEKPAKGLIRYEKISEDKREYIPIVEGVREFGDSITGLHLVTGRIKEVGENVMILSVAGEEYEVFPTSVPNITVLDFSSSEDLGSYLNSYKDFTSDDLVICSGRLEDRVLTEVNVIYLVRDK